MSYQGTKRHGKIKYILLIESSQLRHLHTVVFQLYDIQEKAEL